VSPHLAAGLAGTTIEPHDLVRAAQRAGERVDVLVCEGVGGLLVPLTTGYAIRDLAVDLHLPVVIAARPGLGTISHSLLAVESARVAGLEVKAVVLTPWPDEPTTMEESNRATIAQIAGVQVATLAETTPDDLAAAGATLPLDDWIDA
jgi:dethiobiotin synthetase